VFDESVPLEKSSWISPYNVGIILSYNGIPVNWTPFTSINEKLEFYQIPAGPAVLEWDIRYSFDGAGYRANGALFPFNFLPEKQYYFTFRIIDRQPGLNVYVYDIGEKIVLGESLYIKEKLFGFVPFSNVPPISNATVLLE
jgi:hypothetical protein